MTDKQYLLSLTVRTSVVASYWDAKRWLNLDILLQLRHIRSALQCLFEAAETFYLAILLDAFLGHHDGAYFISIANFPTSLSFTST